MVNTRKENTIVNFPLLNRKIAFGNAFINKIIKDICSIQKFLHIAGWSGGGSSSVS
jgi:hypothetical protein